jgi:hypothetical protein
MKFPISRRRRKILKLAQLHPAFLNFKPTVIFKYYQKGIVSDEA